MLSRNLTRAARPALASSSARALFSTASRTMAEGDTGAVRPTGGSGDSFRQREKANEDYTVRQREMEKLHQLKKKLDEQHQHLDELKKSIKELEKEQGGEQK